MNKAKVILTIIIAIIVLVVLFYFLNKSVPPTATTDTPDAEKIAEPEKIPFDTNDNLDQAIEELKVLDNL